MPAVEFTLKYTVLGNALTVEIEYEIAKYVENLPRFGLEFAIGKEYAKFSYIGFGPSESYIDKRAACEYGHYESTAEENYEKGYVRPQESGSHFASKYLCMDGLFTVTAEKEFSFSVNPYTTAQLFDTKHHFELTENEFVTVCLDVAMRGVGSHSCGPKLDEEYEIPRKSGNKFTLTF